MHALPPRPNAIAFWTAERGLLGTTRTIEVTADGGKSWRVVFRAPRPVVSITFDPGVPPRAILDDGENLAPTRGWSDWRPTTTLVPQYSPCPPVLWRVSFSRDWALCAGQGGAGNMGKAVYRLTTRGWRRVAYTPFGERGYGGISGYGYPNGIAMAADGFGLIWESRGTLYVTRDGGSHWVGLASVAPPEIDFGLSASALPHGVGFVLLERGGPSRLLETDDYGRTWHVVHRWR